MAAATRGLPGGVGALGGGPRAGDPAMHAAPGGTVRRNTAMEGETGGPCRPAGGCGLASGGHSRYPGGPEALLGGDPLLATVWEAKRRLGLSQRKLGNLVGLSLRTMQRWSGRRSTPGALHVTKLAAAVHPVDAELAQRLVAHVGHTLESAGIAGAALPPPSPLRPFVVDSVVAAASETLDISPRLARPALLAALERAKAAGLSLDDLLAVLRPAPPAPTKASKA
jgi:hypothetical protein